jgi:hypothetical protein
MTSSNLCAVPDMPACLSKRASFCAYRDKTTLYIGIPVEII